MRLLLAITVYWLCDFSQIIWRRGGYNFLAIAAKGTSIIICMAIFDNYCQIIMNTTGITDHLFATYVDVLKCDNADHFESAIFLEQFAFTCCRIMAAVIVL